MFSHTRKVSFHFRRRVGSRHLHQAGGAGAGFTLNFKAQSEVRHHKCEGPFKYGLSSDRLIVCFQMNEVWSQERDQKKDKKQSSRGTCILLEF